MRRKIACIFAACLFAVSAAMPVSAATAAKGSAQGTGFVDSVENKKPDPDPDKTYIIIPEHDPLTPDDIEPYGFRFVITSVAEAEQGKAPCQEIADDLLAARDEISKLKAPEVTFMTAEDEAKFNDAKGQAEKAGNVFICCDLFDASIVRKDNGEKVGLDNLYFDPDLVYDAEGQHIDNKITLTLHVNDADDVELVMHREKGEWQVVDFVNNGDGTLTFTLDSLCPIAFYTSIGSIIPDKPVNPGGDPPTPTPPGPPHPKPDNPTPGYTPPHPVPSTTDPTTTPTNETPTATPVSNTTTTNTVTESPNTGTGTGSVLLVSAILAVLAGSVLVIKAKKE